ncbi:hypothetical protein JHK82_049882 [Glycine max]|nr:hypothetical protein JHK85_050508 [Glycine max]KAG5091104.1 hypothetical protein JHK82_049882 [Glycine max]KAG5094204.1 hypothetical protein JHK84_049792 [Glycine max]
MEVRAVDPYTTNPGPIDGSVLYDQDKHVSTAVWDGQERGALRCHEHTSKLDQWTLTHKQIELCWSYFHLNIGRPKLNLELMHDRFPFVLRWKGKQSGPTANRDVVFYRKALDSLKPCDVEWLPYRNMDSMVIPEHIKSTLILGRSKTMLICFDKAERHLPNRCLRQYGMLQSIPDDVERWERKSRGVDGGVDLSGKMESELNDWMDRQVSIVDGDEGVDESEYMEWYLRITRKFIGRPISLSSEFQRTNAGLRDIAHIADTFSTKGLDPQQIESISRIRYIAHECLRDQFGGPVMASGSTQVELGKRVRGKERVRRKGGTGKRLRKDGVVQYNAVSEDEQAQYYGTAIEVGQLHLSHIERELNHAQLCTVDNEVSVVQLIHANADGENMQLCDPHIEVDESDLGYAAGEENNEDPDDVAAEFSHEELKHRAGEEIKQELNHLTGEENIEELNAANEIHFVQPSELCDVSHDIDSTLADAAAEVNHSQLGDSSVINPQQSSPTDNLVNSQLSHINPESELPSAKGAMEVSQHSSIETREDISQNGDCTVAV